MAYYIPGISTQVIQIPWDQLPTAQESIECNDPRRFFLFNSVVGQSAFGRVIKIEADLNSFGGPIITVFNPDRTL